MPPLLSVVLPVYQNEGSVTQLCNEIFQNLDPHTDELDYEIVLVNDGSTDRSWEVLQELYRLYPQRVTIINLTRNFGQLSALMAGYAQAQGDCVVSMAADLQDPADKIWEMFLAWRAGHKLVAGRRASRQDGFIKDRISALAWKLLRRFAVRNIPEGGFDFFLMDKEIRDYYITNPEQVIFMHGRLLYYGCAPYFIDYERRKRSVGRSQTGLGQRLKYFIDGFTAYSYLPLRFMSACGLLLCLISLGTAAGLTWYVLVYSSPIQGWTSLMVAILFLSGVQMLFLGILGEYLWRGLEEIRRRPHYIIQQRVLRQGSQEPSRQTSASPPGPLPVLRSTTDR